MLLKRHSFLEFTIAAVIVAASLWGYAKYSQLSLESAPAEKWVSVTQISVPDFNRGDEVSFILEKRTTGNREYKIVLYLQKVEDEKIRTVCQGNVTSAELKKMKHSSFNSVLLQMNHLFSVQHCMDPGRYRIVAILDFNVEGVEKSTEVASNIFNINSK